MSPTIPPYPARRLQALPRGPIAAQAVAAGATSNAPLQPRAAPDDDLVATHWTRCLHFDPIWPRPRRSRPALTSGLALLALYVVLHLAVGGVLQAMRWMHMPTAADTQQVRLAGVPAIDAD
jgi:hypothetical protein